MSFSRSDEKKVFIGMQDGVSLCCRLYFPGQALPGKGLRLPALVCLCTDSSEIQQGLLRYYSDGGFVCLELFFRGRGESGGLFSLGRGVFHDLEDFFKWLRRQSWYSGICGFYGTDAGATFGLQFSQSHPELVRAMILSSFVVNYDSQGLCTNGVFDLPGLKRLLNLACSSAACRENPGIRTALQSMNEHFSSYARYWPFAAGSTPLSLLPEYEEIARDFIRSSRPGQEELHRRYTAEQFFAGYPQIPLLLFSQWQDDRLRSVLKTYYELSYRREKDLQCFITAGSLAEMTSDQSPFHQNRSYREYTLGWLRHHLAGQADRQFACKKIYYQNLTSPPAGTPAETAVQAGGLWEQAVFWPPEEQGLLFYLHKDSCLTTLASRTEDDRAGSTFFSDPRSISLPEDEAGEGPGRALLQSCLPYLRGDMLSFLAPPLKREIKLSGSVQVRLFVHCTAPDGDLYCRLSCRPPLIPGEAPALVPVPLCESIQRFSHYRRNRSASSRQPDYCRLYEFCLSPVAAVLPAGSRLQFDLAGSHFPRYAVSNQTGIADLRGTTGPVSYYRIYHNQQCPSCIILPIRRVNAGRKATQTLGRMQDPAGEATLI